MDEKKDIIYRSKKNQTFELQYKGVIILQTRNRYKVTNMSSHVHGMDQCDCWKEGEL